MSEKNENFVELKIKRQRYNGAKDLNRLFFLSSKVVHFYMKQIVGALCLVSFDTI